MRGKFANRTGIMSGVSPQPHHPVKLASNISEARVSQRVPLIMCMPATILYQQKFEFSRWQDLRERKTTNPCSTIVNKIILFTTTLVLLETNSCSVCYSTGKYALTNVI